MMISLQMIIIIHKEKYLKYWEQLMLLITCQNILLRQILTSAFLCLVQLQQTYKFMYLQ